jgi:hypothetical protein
MAQNFNKITRGISKEFAEAFKNCELHKLWRKNRNDTLLAVRNNYMNIYYNCDSIAKIEFINDTICCKIDKYYLNGKHYKSNDKEKHFKTDAKLIYDKFEIIKKNSEKKSTNEKKVQSKLVLLNNSNRSSNWYCIDVEYVKQFKNKNEKKESGYNGRFDIIAVSKSTPHRVALIELKYGAGSMGGKSGVFKHVEDFFKFKEKKYFENHLKLEIIEIIKSLKYLDPDAPINKPLQEDLLVPEYFFITIDNNAKNANKSTPKQTMAGYLFSKKRWDCKKLSKADSVETVFGEITKKSNKICATFLFSKATLDTLKINDIIDGKYDERIIPK